MKGNESLLKFGNINILRYAKSLRNFRFTQQCSFPRCYTMYIASTAAYCLHLQGYQAIPHPSYCYPKTMRYSNHPLAPPLYLLQTSQRGLSGLDYSEDGGGKILRNDLIHIPIYTASYTERLHGTYIFFRMDLREVSGEKRS